MPPDDEKPRAERPDARQRAAVAIEMLAMRGDLRDCVADDFIAAIEAAGLVIADATDAAYPTLALAQFLSPLEQRALWLSLYAAAFARGIGPDASIVVARGGVAELSAAIVAGVPALPSWLREHEDYPPKGAGLAGTKAPCDEHASLDPADDERAPCDSCKRPCPLRALSVVPGIRQRLCEDCYRAYRVRRG